MTSTFAAPPGVVVIDIEDTVTIHVTPDPQPGAAGLADWPTRRLIPSPRRPDADPSRLEDRRSFAGIDSVTGENPLLGVEQVDPAQEAFNRFYAAAEPATGGRHRRTDQPGLIARLRQRVWGAR